jgi:hypothetical protein
MKITVTGRVVDIKQTQQFNSGFVKRAAWIELSGGGKYPQTVEIEAHKETTERLDGFRAGDAVEVDCYLQGRVWTTKAGEDRVTNTLKVAAISQAATGPDGDPLADLHPGRPAAVADGGPDDRDMPF